MAILSPSPQVNDGYQGQQDLASSNTLYNELLFVISRQLAKVSVALPVKVVAVYGGGVGPAGIVDVQPLINRVDGSGDSSPAGTIYTCPFLRAQGGLNALILDPQAGDNGFVVFCDRDISNFLRTRAAANPGSQRRFNLSDAVYMSTWSGVAPTRYLQISDAGIKLESNGQPISIHGASLTETVEGEITLVAESLEETISGAVNLTATSVIETVTGEYQITVPELDIVGNLKVSGLISSPTIQGVAFGGSGADLSETGGPGQVVQQTIVGGPFTVGPMPSPSLIVPVLLGPGPWATNQPFRLVDDVAYAVTSRDVAEPAIDGVTLESGVEGQIVNSGRFHGAEFPTPLALPGVDGGGLWLAQTATSLTSTPPSLIGGDIWAVYAGRRNSQYSLLFSPEPPIKL